MLADAKPVAFVTTTDYARARAFYEGVLGLPVVKLDEYALVMQTAGSTLRIVRMAEVAASQHTVFGFEAADVPATVKALSERGVAFERYEFFGDAQGPDGVWSVPGGGQVAWFKDPDGNDHSVSRHAA